MIPLLKDRREICLVGSYPLKTEMENFGKREIMNLSKRSSLESRTGKLLGLEWEEIVIWKGYRRDWWFILHETNPSLCRFHLYPSFCGVGNPVSEMGLFSPNFSAYICNSMHRLRSLPSPNLSTAISGIHFNSQHVTKPPQCKYKVLRKYISISWPW